MRVDREQGLDGIVIEAETPQESELLADLWCNNVRAVAFERKRDRLTTLTVAPTALPGNKGEKKE